MALRNLTQHEREVVLECLRASVEGPFFPDWEFSILFGLRQEEVREVIQQWPVDDESDEIANRAISSAMNNLLGYPHGQEQAWQQYISVSKEEVRTTFRKWRGEEVKSYFDGMK